jgi:F-type H+-transporting ATPase subunit delta
VVDFNRARELISIVKLFLKLCQEHYDIHYVLVTSSYPLSKSELTALENALKTGIGLSHVTINNEVDPTIIGGIKLKTNAVSIDDTISGKLDKMRESSFKLAQQGE